jgi:hypothetical protein
MKVNKGLPATNISTIKKTSKSINSVKEAFKKSGDAEIAINQNRLAEIDSKSKVDVVVQKNDVNRSTKKQEIKTGDVKMQKVTIDLNDFDLNYQIENGLKQAFVEINKLDWKGVEQNIKNSFKEINLEELPLKEKEALLLAQKYISTLNIKKPSIKTEQLLKELRKNQRVLDSLRTTSRSTNTQRNRFFVPTTTTKARIQILNNPSEFFVYGFNNDIENEPAKKRPGKSANSETFEIFQDDIRPAAPQESSRPDRRPVFKKLDKGKKIIIEI